ncbi:MAG: glycosyltransferase family 9 protein [Gemmatimonadales bacterium]
MDHPPGFIESSFRKPHRKWLGRAAEAVSPLLRLAARGASKSPPSSPSEWKKGLILSHNHMGDVLYRTCSLSVLRSALPNCEWSFLTSPSSAEVIENNPALFAVLPWNTGENAWSLSGGSFRQLRDWDFDVALCTNSLRYHPDLFLASALGIPNRVSFTHKGLTGLVTHPIDIDFPNSYASYFQSMVSQVTGVAADWPLKPRIFPDQSAEAAGKAMWERHALGGEQPIIACSITTRQKAGNFPAERLLDVLAEVRSRRAIRIVFFGAAGDGDVLTTAAQRFGNDAVVIAGELTVPALAAFLRRCALLLSLDSGPRHLGNAAGIPVFFARNMSHSQSEAGAYCETETDIAPPGEYLSDVEIAAIARDLPVGEIVTRVVASF